MNAKKQMQLVQCSHCCYINDWWEELGPLTRGHNEHWSVTQTQRHALRSQSPDTHLCLHLRTSLFWKKKKKKRNVVYKEAFKSSFTPLQMVWAERQVNGNVISWVYTEYLSFPVQMKINTSDISLWQYFSTFLIGVVSFKVSSLYEFTHDSIACVPQEVCWSLRTLKAHPTTSKPSK